jgi:hypothetical protein
MRRLLWIAVAASFLTPTFVASPAKAWLTSECRSLAMEVRTKKKPHKAMVSGHHLDTEYCGGSWQASSKDAAIKAALAACRKVGVRDCTVVWAE